MPNVKMPDGVVVAFPDDMPPEQIRALILHKFPEAGKAQPDMYASGNVKKLSGGVAPSGQPGTEPPSLAGGLTTFLEHGISDLPIVGPVLQGTGDAISTTLQGALTGQDPAMLRAELAKRRKARDATYPLSATSGAVTGNIASMMGLGATKLGAEALGMTGKLLPRVLNSSASSGAIAGADAAVRGNNPLEAGLTGAAIGGAIPLVGGAIGQGIKAIGRKAAPLVGAIRNPQGEAARRVGTAYNRDAAANPGLLANQTDEAVARANNMPLLNVDRGGETTRALARSVANQSPEARAVIENTVSNRFGGQGTRAAAFVNRMAGGGVDDIAVKESFRRQAAAENRPAYERAYNAPGAQNVFTQPLQELLQAPAIQKAIRGVMTRSSNRAAVDGFVPVRDVPFRAGSDGRFRLVQRADGTLTAPSLRFWDQVKRNLDGDIDKAMSPMARNRELSADLVAIKTKLVTALDNAVPQYRTARQGAAAFFGAEDAVDAGRRFANQPRLVPEARQAFSRLRPVERESFQIGFASELVDRIKSVGDRSNVINQVFKSPAMREMIELVFGGGRARELEAYVRVEDIAERLRAAMGNSTTARQLMEMGIGAGAGAAFTGGDWKGALTGAAAARGARFVGQKLDDRVMQEVSRLLLAGDEQALRRAIHNATLSENWMQALDAIGVRLDAIAKGTGLALAS